MTMHDEYVVSFFCDSPLVEDEHHILWEKDVASLISTLEITRIHETEHGPLFIYHASILVNSRIVISKVG